jgi:cell division protein FtsI (penicillin-binding protein 3)
VLSSLGIKTKTNFATNSKTLGQVWGLAQRQANAVSLYKRNNLPDRYVPDVHGMGARDAVFLMEKRGVRCRIAGRGTVVKQSLEPGRLIRKGDVCTLTLE